MANVQHKIQLGLLDDDIAGDIKEIPAEQFLARSENKDAAQLTETTYKIAKNVISPRSKTPQLVSPQTMKKKITQHLTVKVVRDVNEEVPQRPWLIRKDTMIDTVNDKSGLLIKDAIKPDILVNFGKRATLAEIEGSFKNINHLLDNYQKYTVNYTDDYGSRIMETIFYAFSAPFISVMRQHARSKEERNDIPQFLFLGGIAGSGKSSLLRILAKMMRVSTKTEDFINYNTILPRGVHNKKSQTITQLENWLLESNVYPLLIDEIPGEFFGNSKYGNDLIVNVTNEIDNAHDTYPALIGTTNNDAYSLPERARRRSYYLKNDKPFDEEYRQASVQAYKEVLDGASNTLFQDFVLRFADKIQDETTQWSVFEHGGKVDFLTVTRNIFKEYYAEMDQPLPIYFPQHRYDDSQESNQEKWRKLFLGSSREDFTYNKETKTLLFKITTLDENASRYGDDKPSRIYKDALSPKVIVGTADGIDIKLNAALFFKWIDIENPFKHRSGWRNFFK